MTDRTDALPPSRNGRAAGLLKSMLVAQCALAVLVAAGDFPSDILGNLWGAEPPVPEMDVPVAPGDQTRQFKPGTVPFDLPPIPGLRSDEPVPPRLEFNDMQTADRKGAVLLNGTVAPGDAERFAKWLDERPVQPTRFALNSPGGDVGEALKIGRLIRASGRPVSMAPGAYCFSACPYMLAGGIEREVSRKAFVGVHQHYFGENTYLPAFLMVSDIQSGQAQVMTYLGEMGIDPMLMAKALATPPDDIYILVPEELQAFRLSTVTTD